MITDTEEAVVQPRRADLALWNELQEQWLVCLVSFLQVCSIVVEEADMIITNKKSISRVIGRWIFLCLDPIEPERVLIYDLLDLLGWLSPEFDEFFEYISGITRLVDCTTDSLRWEERSIGLDEDTVEWEHLSRCLYLFWFFVCEYSSECEVYLVWELHEPLGKLWILTITMDHSSIDTILDHEVRSRISRISRMDHEREIIPLREFPL